MPANRELRDYQAETLLSLLGNITAYPGETFTVMFPRQAGKNEVSSALVAAVLLANVDRGGSVVICAPTYYPQAQISYQRTTDRLQANAARLGHRFSVDGNTLRYGNASAVFLSGSPEANVAGHTASLLLIGDEAQDLDEDWFNRQFRPMTASTGAPVVLFGTPWQGDSLLEKAVGANRLRDERFASHAILSYFPWHNEASWRRVTEKIPAYGRYVEQECARLGADHPIYLSQYELVAARAENRLLSASQIWSLEGPFGPLESPVLAERYVGGLDFGGEGEKGDATVLTLARLVDAVAEVIHVVSWRGRPFHEVSAEVTAVARAWRLERLVCDATGMGAPLTSGLARELGRRIEPLTFTRPEKSALGFELIAAASTGSLRIAAPTNDAFRTLWDELRTCRSELVASGQISWQAPSGRHDDCVASLALCLRAAQKAGPPRVAVGR